MQHSVAKEDIDLVNSETGSEFCMENKEELYLVWLTLKRETEVENPQRV